MRGPRGGARRLRGLFARSRRAGADLGRAWHRHRRARRDHRAACLRARGATAEVADSDAIEAETPHPLRIAIVGRPNAGKSTLVNAMLGEERMITGPEAGITRDAIAVSARMAGPHAAAVRYRRAAAQDAGRGTRRGAFGRRCAEGDPLCRGRRADARRRAPVREAGSCRSPIWSSRRGGRWSSPSTNGTWCASATSASPSCARNARVCCRRSRAWRWCRCRR